MGSRMYKNMSVRIPPIGTFGQRAAWQIPLPPPGPQGAKIIHLIPPDLHRSSSFETIHTISGAVKSKWM